MSERPSERATNENEYDGVLGALNLSTSSCIRNEFAACASLSPSLTVTLNMIPFVLRRKMKVPLVMALITNFAEGFRSIVHGQKVSMRLRQQTLSYCPRKSFDPFVAWRFFTTPRLHATTPVAASTEMDAESGLDVVEAEYKELMQELMMHSRTMKKLSSEDVAAAQDILLSTAPILALDDVSAKTTGASDRETLLPHLESRQAQFMAATGMGPNQYDYYSRCLSYFADVCAKRQRAAPARLAWRKLRECAHAPIENCLSTYLYVFGLDDAVDGGTAAVEVAELHDLLFAPNEKTLTLRIKGLVAQGDVQSADALLSATVSPRAGGEATELAQGTDWRRLRTFQPLLDHYCDGGQVNNVLRLFRDMRDSPGVFMEPQTYAQIISCLALQGCFAVDANPVEMNMDLRLSSTCGPELLDSILSEMSEDLLELNEESAMKIVRAFLRSPEPPTNSSANETFIANSSIFLKRVSIDKATAVCPDTGIRLKLFALSEEQRQHVRETLVNMAASQHEEFGQKLIAKGKKCVDRDGEYAKQKLLEFSDWLSIRQDSGTPYTAFIDGPNVAYYGHGDIHYSQVLAAFQKLEQMGEKPLIIMPEKYTASRFNVPLGGTQKLSEREVAIIQTFLQNEQMYSVPWHCLDDYYWMFASVVDHRHPDLNIPLEDKNGRLPGVRPMLVTNDQMRDHKLSLLSPREFRRWTGCHIVNYSFTPYADSEWEEREVEFHPADLFSREIQCNKHPKRSGESVWHIPVAEWPHHERLCIHLTR